MRRPRFRSREDGAHEIELTPMIDMVFILLIFFIVSTSFIREAGVVVERPAASTGEAQEVQVVIAIDADNVLWLEGDTVDIRALGGRVSAMLVDRDNLGIIVAADIRSNSGVLVRVLDLCRQAGVANVSVATKEAT